MILPESCLESGDVLTKHQQDKDNSDDDDSDEDVDDDSYLTAEEEVEEALIRKINVATQTDPLTSTCYIS